MAVWVGGVVLLARVVLAGPGEEDLVHAVRGFGRISGPAIVVTVVSGLVQLYRLDGGSLFSEPPRPGAAAEDGARRGDAVRRPDRPPGRPVPPGPRRRPRAADRRPAAPGVRHRGRRRRRRARAQRLAARRSPRPRSPRPTGSTTPSRRRSSTRVNGLDLTVSLDPGRVGLERAARRGARAGDRLTGLELSFIPPAAPERRRRPADPAHRAPASPSRREGGGIPFDVAGAWTLQVSATTPIGHVVGGPAAVRRAHRRRRRRRRPTSAPRRPSRPSPRHDAAAPDDAG